VRPPYISDHFLEKFITAAFVEDVGDGDYSTQASIPAAVKSRARLLVKENGILAGVELAQHIFKLVDPTLSVDVKLEDGSIIKSGDEAYIVEGSARSILTSERLVLNCMQRMSGIATLTHRLVELVKGTKAVLLDTRKTTPNFRLLEKWSVLLGGGQNHRMGLFDMVMLKDNHVDMAGGIEQAILRTKEYLRATNRKLKIEIETRTLKEVEEVLRVGNVDIIMLDNMSIDEMKKAVWLIKDRYKTEASGGITEQTIRDVAECGVDYISVGALTHSVKSLDLSLKVY
jgi:nicotinate-nucleotide pyrophosphorylase (carboxylating)